MSLNEIYNQIDHIRGWFSYQQAGVLFPYVFNLPTNNCLVEISTFHGRSTKFFSLVNPFIKIYTIDLMVLPEGNKEVPSKIDDGVLKDSKITQLIGDSSEIVKTFDEKINFLFIDGDHRYEGVRKDIDNWLPKVSRATNCYVAFHDYEETHKGVMRAVDETKQLQKIIAKDGVWVGKRI